VVIVSAVAAGDADADAGRALYQVHCTACHSLGHIGVGPAHRGVFGRASAQPPGFGYSESLKASRQAWNEDTLDRWLADPEQFAPGQRMGANVPEAKDRGDLIAFLKQATNTAR
jgi:cytochrome c